MYKFLIIFFFLLGISGTLFSQTKTSTGNGNWSNANTWTPSGVPTITNNVVINDGNTINLDVSGSCNSLTIGTGLGAATVFRFSGNSTKTLTVNSDILINTNGSFTIRNNVNTGQFCNLSGNLINNGVVDFSLTANRSCDLTFVNNGNQSISGTGTTTDLNDLFLNMGSSSNNILEVTSAGFTVPNNFLRLTNGTFKLSTPNAVSAVPFTALTTIPSTSGLWLNSSNATLSSSAGIINNGLIRLSSGTLTVGDADTEDLTAGTGTLLISGGLLNIASKYNASNTSTTFSMSGGSIVLPTVLSSNTLIAPFHLSAPGSSFNMSGGSIIIQREGGSGAQDLGYLNTGSIGSISGGTLQIGNSLTPASQSISINSSSSIGNLLLNSVNASAFILTNSLQVLGDVVMNSGSLNDNALNIGLGGNWANNGGTFVNGSGTVLFNASAAAQSLFKSGGETFNNIQFSGAGSKTFSSNISAKGFTINNSATVDVSASNFQLNLSGNFSNSGSFNSRSGLVLLNGTTAQTIGGTSITNFFNLSLNNSAGASLTNAENLIGSLTLSNGTFNTNAQAFTMISTATATARVAQITGTGDITGNVTVQRFVPGGTTGWAFLGTPISSALTLNDWDDDLFISCPTCPDGSAGGFLSIYSYNEAASGTFDDPSAYVPLSGINDPIAFGKGMWVYLGNGQFTTTDITIDVTGNLRKNSFSIPLTYNNFGSAADDGWNLIHNPYPSAISWTALRGAIANLDNAIYVYNADLNAGLGAYASFVNGVSSPAIGSGGLDDNIPMSQGFYVHSTGAIALSATEAIKVANTPTFLKFNSSASTSYSNPLLRLHLKGANLKQDETVLYLEAGANDYFEASYDAYKLPGTDLTAPIIALQNNAELFQINGVAPITGNYSVAVNASTGASGNYTLSASNFSSFPQGACIQLYDKFTNTSTDLKSNNYPVFLYDTTLIARFVLNITLNNLNINDNVNQPSCSNSLGGRIVAIGNSAGPWNYLWKDQNGNLIKNSFNKNTADTLDQLSGITIHLEVYTSGLCDHHENDYVIQNITLPIAQFNTLNSIDLQANPFVTFINTSTLASNYYWDFGDGTGTSVGHSPSYQYNLPGVYQVQLIAESIDACTDTVFKQIVVFDKTTGQPLRKMQSGLILKTLGNREFIVEATLSDREFIQAKLMDASGKVLLLLEDLFSKRLHLNLEQYPAGIYLLHLTNSKNKYSFKLPLE